MDKPNEEAKSPKIILVAIQVIGVILVLLLIGFAWPKIFPSRNTQQNQYQIAADTQDIYVNTGEIIKVKIQPDYWSGWIIGAEDTRFTIDTSVGWFEVFLCTGKRILVPVDKWKPLGAVPGNRFRIRGNVGEATIAVFEE